MRNITSICAALTLFFNAASVWAYCAECRAEVKSGIYNEDFASNLFILLLPLFVLALIAAVIYFADDIKIKFKGRVR